MKLSLNAFLSLDGVMQGPGAAEEDRSGGFEAGGWMVPFPDEDFGRIVDEEWFGSAEAVLLGRTTFELMRSYWPLVQDESRTATVLNGSPKFLVSRTITDPDWGDTTVISDDVLGAIRELKARPGGELQIHGSLQLARTVHDAGLVDIYRLLIFPTVVGSGKRLFADGSTPTTFELISSETTSTGGTSLVLTPREYATGAFYVDEDGKEAVA